MDISIVESNVNKCTLYSIKSVLYHIKPLRPESDFTYSKDECTSDLSMYSIVYIMIDYGAVTYDFRKLTECLPLIDYCTTNCRGRG